MDSKTHSKQAASVKIARSISKEIRSSTPDLRQKRKILEDEAIQLQDSIFITNKRLEEARTGSGEESALLARKFKLEETERHLLVEIAVCEKLIGHFGGFRGS